MKRILFTYIAAFSIATAASADDKTDPSPSIIKIAEDYLAAYSTFEPEKMVPFVHDDMVFHDPTSGRSDGSGNAFDFTGREAVLKELGDYAALYQSFTVSYDVERRYESAGVVVFVAQLSYDATTLEGEQSSGTAPIVTVITVKDGKIIKHEDFYDYKGNAVEFKN